MEISFSICQKEEKECIWVKYLIYAVLHDLNFVIIYTLFSAKFKVQDFQSSQKKSVIPSLATITSSSSCKSCQCCWLCRRPLSLSVLRLSFATLRPLCCRLWSLWMIRGASSSWCKLFVLRTSSHPSPLHLAPPPCCYPCLCPSWGLLDGSGSASLGRAACTGGLTSKQSQ